MSFPAITRLSPNRDCAVPNERRGIVFHHTVISFEETIALMTDPARKVSYHCVIAADGTRATLVPDEQVAWHAGISSFRGRTGCNAFMLGLSFAGDTYAAPLTDAQIGSALEWIGPRWSRYGWTIEGMTDHRQVAPGRKDDLNPAEWDRLRQILQDTFGKPV
ncbi:MAG: nucleoside transporter [Verrucomicrobia bacterium]|nr:nucleoside transporter [Verrucomicrobiota bacterium]